MLSGPLAALLHILRILFIATFVDGIDNAEVVVTEFLDLPDDLVPPGGARRHVFRLRGSDTAASAARRFCDHYARTCRASEPFEQQQQQHQQEQQQQQQLGASCEVFVEARATEILRRHGFEWAANAADPVLLGTEPRLQWLRRLAGCPGLVFDIGAHRGEWTRSFNSVCHHSSIVMVEASRHKMPSLRAVADEINAVNATGAPLVADVNLVLAESESAERVFYSSHAHEYANTGDSLYRENSNLYKDDDLLIQHLPTSTLDRLISSMLECASVADGSVPSPLPAPDCEVSPAFARAATAARTRSFTLLKLDVQGAEVDVLRGATEALQSAEDVQLVLLEMSLDVFTHNVAAPQFSEVVAFMLSLGFGVYDIHEIHHVAPMLSGGGGDGAAASSIHDTALESRPLPTILQMDVLFGRGELSSGNLAHET
jgi:hypothetical protein